MTDKGYVFSDETVYLKGNTMSTPVQVLKKVKNAELFRGLKLELFELICRNPKRTAGEIWEMYANLHPTTDRSRNELAKRISDLANLGLVKTSGRVLCPVSGRLATRWVATGRTPQFEVAENGRKKIVNRKTAPKQNLTEAPSTAANPQLVAAVAKLAASKKKQPRTFFGLLFGKDQTAEAKVLEEVVKALGGAA